MAAQRSARPVGDRQSVAPDRVLSVPPPPINGRGGPEQELEAVRVLRGLLDAADDATERLQELVERHDRRDAGSAQASVRLQERLRLGAEMLRAFQTQIERLETAESQLERRLAAARQASDTLDVGARVHALRHRRLLSAGRRRVGQLVRAAVRRVARELDDRERFARELERSVAWQATRLETALASARRLEDRLQELTRRAEKAAKDADAGALRLREMMGLCAEMLRRQK